MIKQKIIIGIFLLFLVFTIGCVKGFKSYNQIVEYCIEKDMPVTCGIEKCIMLNSVEFDANIRMNAENNYYKCVAMQRETS